MQTEETLAKPGGMGEGRAQSILGEFGRETQRCEACLSAHTYLAFYKSGYI